MRPAPTIEVETAIGSALGSRGEFGYSAAFFQPIETGHKRDRRLAIAVKGLALVQAEIRERERQLRFDIRAQFIAAVSDQLKLETLRGLAPVTEENYRVVARRVELGDAAPLEEQLLLAEMRRREAEQIMLAAAGEAATAELRARVGLPGSQPARLRPELRIPPTIPDLATLQQTALLQRSDIQILRILEEQADAETALARTEGRPDITLSARYSRFNTAFDQFGISGSGGVVPLTDSDNILSFGVSIPLFTARRAQASTDAALSRQAQQRLRREHLSRVIPQQVEAAYRRWSGAVRSMETLRTGVIDRSQKNLTVVREAYRLGQLRLLDVLNEQRRLVELQLSYIDTQAQAARALVELEHAVGGPLP